MCSYLVIYKFFQYKHFPASKKSFLNFPKNTKNNPPIHLKTPQNNQTKPFTLETSLVILSFACTHSLLSRLNEH